MLSANRKSDGTTAFAHLVSKADGPFLCPVCDELVVMRKSSIRIDHFAHAKSGMCNYSAGESEAHRHCKLEIYNALLRHPNATNVFLERSLTTARPDVSATINGVPVAIEIQISNLSMDTIIRRTQEYARMGVYVLWLLQWTPYLDGNRYTPRLWEKWIHAAYFGRVYYWVKGLMVACYHFESHHRRIPKATWYSSAGQKLTAGGYTLRSKRYRSPRRGPVLNLAQNFVGRDREWWRQGGLIVPVAKLFIDKFESQRIKE